MYADCGCRQDTALAFCRANLDVTIPTITQDADSGIGREDVGSLLALGTAAYCAGHLHTVVLSQPDTAV